MAYDRDFLCDLFAMHISLYTLHAPRCLMFFAFPLRSAPEPPSAQKGNPEEQTNVSRHNENCRCLNYIDFAADFVSWCPKRCRDEVFKSIRN